MTTPEEILRFIDDRYARMLANPTKYAGSAIQLESAISLLEEIRAFILNRPADELKFTDFLTSHGYGVTGICHEPGVTVMLSDDVRNQLVKVASVLRQFLEAEGRLPQATTNVG